MHGRGPLDACSRSMPARRRTGQALGTAWLVGNAQPSRGPWWWCAVLTAAVVVHTGLGKHGVVLDLALAHSRAVVADDDQLSCRQARRESAAARVEAPSRRGCGPLHAPPVCMHTAAPAGVSTSVHVVRRPAREAHPCPSGASSGTSCSPECTCRSSSPAPGGR